LVGELDELECRLAKRFDEFWSIADRRKPSIVSEKSTVTIEEPDESSKDLLRTVVEQIFEDDDPLGLQDTFPVTDSQRTSKRTAKRKINDYFAPDEELKKSRTSTEESKNLDASVSPVQGQNSTSEAIKEEKSSSEQIKTEVQTHGCDKCEEIFPNRSLLAVHKKNVHSSVNSSSKAKGGKKKPSSSAKIKPGTRTHACNKCQESFPKRSLLRIHKKTAHPASSKPTSTHECKKCPESFPTRDSLRLHQRTVHLAVKRRSPTKERRCVDCGEEFPTARNLRVHRRVHEGVLCPVCGKSFRQDGLHALADHIAAIHRGEKNYGCEVCGEKFGYARNLAKHRRKLHGVHSECDCC
jgi:predicted RNA-binding protein YlxR (DUF448 family)